MSGLMRFGPFPMSGFSGVRPTWAMRARWSEFHEALEIRVHLMEYHWDSCVLHGPNKQSILVCTDDPSLVYCLAFGPSSSLNMSLRPTPAIIPSHRAAWLLGYIVFEPPACFTSLLTSATVLRSTPTVVCCVMKRADLRFRRNSLRAGGRTGTYTLAYERGGSPSLTGICTDTAPAFRKVLYARAWVGLSPKEAQLMSTAVPP
mmetsp:Transcript_3755/g.8163  ORF Transcript_3755/g.8163 Transcript_3755/m.8163 type:complete len:203 (+) Transcript_3755:196-804(+)